MKTIKIILGLVTTLSIVFFSTGLLFKETTYSTQVTIEKPIEEVFSLFNDNSKMTSWIPELKSIQPVEEKAGKTGSTYKIILENKGQELELTEKIMAFVPNEKVTLYTSSKSILKTDDYMFYVKDGHTLITNNSRCKGNSYILSCIFPFVKSKLQRQEQVYLDNFKALAERQS